MGAASKRYFVRPADDQFSSNVANDHVCKAAARV